MQTLKLCVVPAGGDGLRTFLSYSPSRDGAGQREAEEATRVQPPHTLKEEDSLPTSVLFLLCLVVLSPPEETESCQTGPKPPRSLV